MIGFAIMVAIVGYGISSLSAVLGVSYLKEHHSKEELLWGIFLLPLGLIGIALSTYGLTALIEDANAK